MGTLLLFTIFLAGLPGLYGSSEKKVTNRE